MKKAVAFFVIGVFGAALGGWGCASTPLRCPKTPPASTSAQATKTEKQPIALPDHGAEANEQTLVLRGTPEIPEELTERLNRYLNTRSAALGDLSADGNAALVETRFAQTVQLHVVDHPGGARRQLTFRDEPARSATFFPADRSQVVFLSDEGGNEQYRLWQLDLNDARMRPLSPKDSRVVAYLWSPGGKKIAYANNARNGKDFDIYVAKPEQAPADEPVMTVEGYFYPLDFSSDSNLLIVGEYISISESRLHLLDLRSGKSVQLSPKEVSGSYLAAVFDKNDKNILAMSDRDGEFVDLYLTDLKGESWEKLTKDIDWDVEGLAACPSTGNVAFTVNENGYSRLYTLDKRNRPRRIEGSPRVSSGGCALRKTRTFWALASHGRRLVPTPTATTFAKKPLPDGQTARWAGSSPGT